MPYDGTRAAQVMLSFKTWRSGHCLEAVVAAYRQIGVPSLGRPAPTAYVGWQNSDLKHPSDRNPPAGVPVYWGPKKSSAAGDVVISLGGGAVVATDWPRSGVIGVTSIDARERQIGRPYLGWTGDVLGVPISYPQTASSGDNSSEEDDMFTDQDRANLVSVMLALGAGGLNPENERGLRTAVKVMQAVEGQVNGLPDALKAIMSQVNGAPEVLAEIRARAGVSDVQVKAIADAVVKQIGKPTVSLDYAAIAKAVNDDAARRMGS